MMDAPRQITLGEWEQRHGQLAAAGLREPFYGGRLGRHVADGDLLLPRLKFDNSPASLRLWNFLLTEEERLYRHREAGRKIVGAMKDLGTVPVIAYCAPDVVAFYPDGAWWTPCIMQLSTGDLAMADRLGIDESFCPVRAMLGAFALRQHFPPPDLLVCSVGATCDDFSAIAQRLGSMGWPVFWWEIPARRSPEVGEVAITLPGDLAAPAEQVVFVIDELQRVRQAIEGCAGRAIDDTALADGIRRANAVRDVLRRLCNLAFTADPPPLPALELLIAEMLALHFCSDRDESLVVLTELLREVERRAAAGVGPLPAGAARIFWVNPVADLSAMNLLEECGGRLCGTEFLFSHSLDAICEDLPPMESLARQALADPMVGPSADRAGRIGRDAAAFRAEAVVISRIPGASHCALESPLVHGMIERALGLPVVEIEVPPVSDALRPALRNRLEALVETVKARRAAKA